MGKKPEKKEEGRVRWFFEAIVLPYFSILILLIICPCIKGYLQIDTTGNMIQQAFGNGEVALCSFVVMISARNYFTKENNPNLSFVYSIILITDVGVCILLKVLYIIAEAKKESGIVSVSETPDIAFYLSIFCIFASIVFSLVGKHLQRKDSQDISERDDSGEQTSGYNRASKSQKILEEERK